MKRKKISLHEEKDIYEKRYEDAKETWISSPSSQNKQALIACIGLLNLIDKKIYGIF